MEFLRRLFLVLSSILSSMLVKIAIVIVCFIAFLIGKYYTKIRRKCIELKERFIPPGHILIRYYFERLLEPNEFRDLKESIKTSQQKLMSIEEDMRYIGARIAEEEKTNKKLNEAKQIKVNELQHLQDIIYGSNYTSEELIQEKRSIICELEKNLGSVRKAIADCEKKSD